MRYHKIQSNSMQYSTMPCNTMESIKIRFFGSKRNLATLLELAQQHEHHENVVFLKMHFFGPNPFFPRKLSNFFYHHDWTPIRKHFCVDPVARRASGRPPGPIFCPKFCFERWLDNAQSCILCVHFILYQVGINDAVSRARFL